MLKFDAYQNEGTVYGTIEFTNGSMKSEVSLGTFGPNKGWRADKGMDERGW